MRIFHALQFELRCEISGLRGGPTRSDTNQSVQSRKQARSLKIRIEEDEGLYYPSRENKGADQLCSYCEVDLRLCFRISKFRFSHYAAHLVSI